MKRTNRNFYLLILFVVLFSSKNCLAQIVPKGFNDSIEYRISQINEEYIRINNNTAKFKITEQDIFGHSAEGGELSKYYDGKTLRKAILILYGETGQSTSEYYFLSGELIFVHKKNEKYRSPIYMEKPEVKSGEENKFYFKNQRLIRWIGNDGKILDGVLYPEKEEQLLDDLKIIL